MNVQEAIKLQVQRSFGKAAQVIPRRPGKLYQLDLPAFLSDGDGVSVFVECFGNEIRMTDLGLTTTRLSYSHTLSKSLMQELARLAELHGFRLEEGALVADFQSDEIAAAAFGLVQIQSEAEVAISKVQIRAERSESFRVGVRNALKDVFGQKCELDFAAENDPQRLFTVDALIHGYRKPLGVAIAPSDMHAERAVGVKLHASPAMSKETIWVVLPRDINGLQAKTRNRLMNAFIAPIPCFDEGRDALEEKLAQLAS